MNDASSPNPSPARAAERKYRAFVSYSWADKAAGARLFRRLDGYRTPKALHGKATPHGPVPKTLYPCFRDRDEEPTAPDIHAAVTHALSACDNLVVVCSRTSAKSKWVDWEIQTFRSLGRSDRIHAVLIEGEPSESFPPALIQDGVVPLASDLRESGDGWTAGQLKLIAGLLGISYGELRDREIERDRIRTRWITAVAAAFAVLFVVATGALWFALDSNGKLQSALTDILGKTNARVTTIKDHQWSGMTTDQAQREIDYVKELNESAYKLAPHDPKREKLYASQLVLYARLSLDIGKVAEALASASEAASALHRLPGPRDPIEAAALIQEADALVRIGRIDLARNRFVLALAIIDKLPPDQARQARQGAGEGANSLGEIAEEAGDLPEARRNFEKAVNNASARLKEDSHDGSAAHALARYAIGLGRVALKLGDRTTAQDAYQTASQLLAVLIRESPNDTELQRAVIMADEGLADVMGSGRDFAAQKKSYLATLEASRKMLAADPQDLQRQRDVSHALDTLARAEMQMGEIKEARGHENEAIKMHQAMSDRDPADMERKAELANGIVTAGVLASLDGDLEEGRRQTNAGLKIARGVLAKNPGDPVFQEIVSKALVDLGHIERDAGRLPEAMAAFKEALPITRAVAEKNPQDAARQLNLLMNSQLLGELMMIDGDAAGAMPYVRPGVPIAETLAKNDPANPDAQRNLARSYFVMWLGTADANWARKARPILEKLEAEKTIDAESEQFLRRIRQTVK